MKALFFDTETTGLPKDDKKPPTDLNNWPRLVQLAWIVTNDEGHTFTSGNHIVKPRDFIIPDEASDIHGITTSIAIDKGIDIETILNYFNIAMKQADCMIAHNVSFDYSVVSSEIIRHNMPSYMYRPRYCTIKTTVKFCNLPQPNGRGGLKWPKLEELHKALFDKGFKGAHDALQDMEALARCFFELKRRKLLVDTFDHYGKNMMHVNYN